MLERTPYTTWLAAALLVLALVLRQLYLRYDRRRRNDVPLVPVPPNASWLWGHEWTARTADAGEAYMRWLDAAGSTVIRIKGALWTDDNLIVGDPAAVTHIMQRNVWDYHHSRVVRPRLARMLGRSLVWVEGEAAHRRMRAFFTAALSAQAVRSGVPEFFGVAAKLCEDLQHACAASDGPLTINVLEWTGRTSLQIIGRYGFGIDFSHGEEGPRMLRAWRDMATMGMSTRGITALLLLRRFSILNRLPLKAMRDQANVRATIHAQVDALMLQERKPGENRERGEMLSRLLEAMDRGEMDAEELKYHVVMFIMAGAETSALTLSYALWELAKHPAMQDRLRAELGALGARDPGCDELQKMPYLDAVLRETLRFHPVAPYAERVATRDDVLPLRYPFAAADGRTVSEIAIRAGQTVILPVHFLNRAPRMWGPDAGVFRPERWLEDGGVPPADGLPGGWAHTLSFSEGPRLCVGYRLAIVQFKATLCALVRSFRFADARAPLAHKVCSTVQPHPLGAEARGPDMPLVVEAL